MELGVNWLVSRSQGVPQGLSLSATRVGVIAMAIVATMIIGIDHMVYEPPSLLSQGATWDGRIANLRQVVP